MSPPFQFHPPPRAHSLADLLMAPAQIQARAAEQIAATRADALRQSGQVWGQTLGSLATLPLELQHQAMQDRRLAIEERRLLGQEARAARQEQREAATFTAAEREREGLRVVGLALTAPTWQVAEAMVTSRRPELLPELRKEWEALETSKAQRRARLAERIGEAGVVIRGEKADYNPIRGLRTLQELKDEFAHDPVTVRELDAVYQTSLDHPDAIREFAEAAIRKSKHADLLKPKPPIEVSPGASLVDPTTMQPVFTAPTNVKPPDVGSFEDFILRDAQRLGKTPQQLTTEDITRARQRFARAGHVEAGATLTPNMKLQGTMSLRDDWVRESKPVTVIRTALANMRSALKAVEAGNRVAGDQAIVQFYNKILDPNSVVYVAEFARTTQGQTLLDRLRGKYEGYTVGGVQVTKENLREFVNLAEDFARNQTAFLKDTKAQLENIATSFGLDPKHITRDISIDEEGATEPPPPKLNPRLPKF